MKKIFYLLVLNLAIYNFSYAQPGALNRGFGINGKIINESFTGDCRTVTTQKNGKIITGGFHDDINYENSGLLIARFNADGMPDTGFANLGKIIINKAGEYRAAYVKKIAIQKDEKIVVYARFYNPLIDGGDVGLVRLNNDGSLDESFGSNGIVITNIGIDDAPGDMILQEDGKILITGNKGVNESQASPGFIVRYLPDGTIDKGFGSNGFVFTQLKTIFKSTAIAINSENKILIGGSYLSSSNIFAVLQYNLDGDIDERFGIGGIAKMFPRSGNFGALNDITIQDGGNILLTGNYGTQMILGRLSGSGEVDSSFGREQTGYTTFLPEKGNANGKTIFGQNQNIIVTGVYDNGFNTGFGVFAFKSNGIPDSSFGENGVAVSGFNDLIHTMETGVGALTPDGNIIVAGAVLPADDEDFFRIALVEYNGYAQKQILITKIRRWLRKHGFTWDDWPRNDIASYSVQRSSNGINWTTIFNRRATTSNQRPIANSNYEDPAPLSGTNYYRLQTTSTDGAVAYSNVIAITNDYASVVRISPNPAKNNLRIEGLPAGRHGLSSGKSKLTVVDLAGNIKLQAVANSKTYNLNIASLKAGNYLLKIEKNGEVLAKKFIKE